MNLYTMSRSRNRQNRYIISLCLGVLAGFLYRNMEQPPLPSPVVPTNLTSFLEIATLLRSYITGEDSEDPFMYMKEEETLLTRNGSRVLCIMFSHVAAYRAKADHAYSMWAKKCDYTFVASGKPDPTGELPVVTLDLEDTYKNLWGKTQLAFAYAWEEYKDKVDWFVKTDDDTYMIVENLKLLLSSYDPEAPIFFGCKSQSLVKQGYMSGGAGYVLSREATRRFVELALRGKLLRPDKKCAIQKYTGAEDAEMGKCLEAVNVTAGDSRDFRGRESFMPVPFESYMTRPVVAPRTWWLRKKWLYYASDEWRCLSNTPVACHYVSPSLMHVYEYVVYRLHAHGHTRVIYMSSPPDTSVAGSWVGG